MTLAMAVDPFANSTRGKSAQSISKILLEKDETIDSILRHYRIYAAVLESIATPDNGGSEASRYLNGVRLPIATPKQIDLAYQLIAPESDIQTHEAGKFLSKLVQASFDAGYNGFLISASQGIDEFPYELTGKENDTLKIEIYGNAGNQFGSFSAYLDVTLQGSAGNHPAFWTKDSIIVIGGDVGTHCGVSLGRSKISILGNAGDSPFMDSQDSNWYIGGKIGDLASLFNEDYRGNKNFPNRSIFHFKDERSFEYAQVMFGKMPALYRGELTSNRVRLVQ